MCDHRLRGSASTVLTVTGQVNGRWRNLTPHRIETHEPIAIISTQLIMFVRGPPKPNLVQIHPLVASGNMGEVYRFCVFIYLFIPFFLRLAYRSDRLTDFYALDVKSRKDVPFRGYKT